MTELSLPFGPWRKLASAEWGGHPLSVYVNNESLIMLTVFDKSGDNVTGMLVLLKKPLVLDGSTDAFSSSQKRELVFLEKRSPDYHVKFLLVEATPYYVPYSQQELIATLQRQHQELQGLTKVLIDTASEFDIKVKELTPVDSKTLELLTGDPFTLFSLSGIPPAGEGLRATGRASRLKLGMDASKNEVDVLSTSMSGVFVVGEDRLSRVEALQVLCESALSAGIPCLVFDSSKTLAGLSVPTKDEKTLEEYGMVPLSSAFPFKAYALGKGLFINLRFLDADCFMSGLGAGNKEVAAALQAAYPESSSLDDLVEKVSKLAETKTLNAYVKAKALRCLRVLQKAYPTTFGKNTFAELSAPWDAGMPKVFYVDVSSVDESLSNLLMLSLMREMKQPPSAASALCVFEQSADKLSRDVKNAVAEKTNVAFAFHASHEEDFAPLEPTLTLELVGDDVIATEPHKEKKRFKLRPLLTLFASSGLSPSQP
ncbi:hypothetical protein HZC09_03505 [Candidatus Micrarchaeota archaeon]|nr:hypothetical protein [Candidatus Micrarchaeota archaeon]